MVRLPTLIQEKDLLEEVLVWQQDGSCRALHRGLVHRLLRVVLVVVAEETSMKYYSLYRYFHNLVFSLTEQLKTICTAAVAGIHGKILSLLRKERRVSGVASSCR
jgi:hypothetical protein